MIIAIEGADSIGKDTLIDLIKEKHPEFVFGRFPNENNSSGKFTRKILLRTPDLPSIVLQHLFISNFFEDYIWLSHFKRSKETLILNRYFMSTLAYSMAQDINIRHFKEITGLLPQPDLWILLERKRRGISVGDRHDVNQDLQDSVMKNYRALFKRNPEYPHAIIINDSTPESMLAKFEIEVERLNKKM